jgi:hypothetical protein
MAKVIFIEGTKRFYKPSAMRLAWGLVGVLAVIATAVFIYRPDWLLVPPGL